LRELELVEDQQVELLGPPATLVHEHARVKEDICLRAEEANRLRCGEAIEERHFDVEQHDIRLTLDRDLHCLATVDGSSDDLEVRHLTEHDEEQLEEGRRVVGNHESRPYRR
jgi:adenine-specific DNA methylase